jgi:uncharacterized protein YjbJ (UPF0337 family)
LKPSTKDRTEGKLHEVEGKIKEKVGKATNDANLEVPGKAGKSKPGKVQKWIGRAEKVLGNKGHINTGSQNAKEGTMSQTALERTAEHIAESAVADAIEDGIGVVRHAAEQSGDAAEEFLNDTTQRLQRNLALTVATTFAAGLTAGALIGWMMKRR